MFVVYLHEPEASTVSSAAKILTNYVAVGLPELETYSSRATAAQKPRSPRHIVLNWNLCFIRSKFTRFWAIYYLSIKYCRIDLLIHIY